MLGDGPTSAGGVGGADTVDIGVRGRLVGTRIRWFDSVDSTNAVLKSLAEAGEPSGAVVVADEQTRGRGRAGRAWHSPAGLGLWFSVLLRPRSPARELTPLSLVVSSSVATAVAAFCGVDVRVKWPNDIVVGGRKLGGILLESLGDTSSGAGHLVVGVGLNVDLDRGDFPGELADTATSLLILTGRRTRRRELLRAVLERLDEDWARFEDEGPASSLERWRSLSTTLGKVVEVSSETTTVRGTAVDLSSSGALIVELPGGRRVEVWHGDLRQQEGTDD